MDSQSTSQVYAVVVLGWLSVFILAEGTSAQMARDDARHEYSSDSSYFFYQQSDYPKDCKEVFDQCSSINSSGVYYIRPGGYPEAFEVYCDNTVETGGWTVIQTRHMNSSIEFTRNWESYKHGFGFLSQDFWLGNEKLAFMTNQDDYELLIEMTMSNGTIFLLSYNNFRIGVEHNNYRLISISHNFIKNAHIAWPLREDCQDLYNAGIRDNGVYMISPTNWSDSPFGVYCNMTDDGGWTVFQRRVDGSVDFYRDWVSFKSGFGDMMDEFWLGNKKLYYLTNQRSYKMRIDFVNANGAPYYAEYYTFHINNEDDNYRLVLGTFSGTASSDSLNQHRDRPFTTKDRDNDGYGRNCAVNYHGAWWYNACHDSNLNGGYHNSGNTGLRWNGCLETSTTSNILK